MSPIKRLLLGLALLVGVLAAVSFALPRQVSVARSIEINAPESDIFPYLNNLRQFNRWSPWAARDPKTQYAFTGPRAGKGAGMSWNSEHPQVGKGSQRIVESQQNALVRIALDFGDMGQATAFYRLTPAGAGTKVTWGFSTDVGVSPLARWMGLMMDRWVGGDYEEGLSRLKSLVESEGRS